MKLIISPMEALRTYVSRESYFYMRDLIEKHGWKHAEPTDLWADSRPLAEALSRRCGRVPDVILFWEGYPYLNDRSQEIAKLDCYKCIFCVDIHWRSQAERAADASALHQCDLILAWYGNVFPDFFPGVAKHKPVVWIPHAASTDFLLPYNERAENAIFLSGAINRHYPMRQRMLDLSDDPELEIVRHRHPGYSRRYDYETAANVGRGFAEKIQRFRVAFADSSRYRYILGKFFEIPATGALLFTECSATDALGQLGFIEDEHYVAASSDDLVEKIRYLLDESNHSRLDRIRKRAQRLVLEKHTVGDRARLIDEACSAPP